MCDEGLTLGNLVWTLHTFFKRLGLEKLRFKPAYNPYTEPSMEIFSYRCAPRPPTLCTCHPARAPHHSVIARFHALAQSRVLRAL